VDGEVRVCRVSPTFPNSEVPGGGLPGYYATLNLALPTLYITRLQGGCPFPVPAHVQLARIRYPDIELHWASGMIARAAALAYKLFGYGVLAIAAMPRVIRFRPHVVHLHTPIPLKVGLLAKWLLGCRLVVTIHGSELFWLRRSPVLRWGVNQADAVCFVTESMRDELSHLLSVKALVYTPNGVDMQTFFPGEAARVPQFLAVGNFRNEKGFDVLMRAFRRVRQRFADVRLIMVGDGLGREAVEDLAREIGIGTHVEFRGSCQRDEVAKLMRESRVFVMSSRSEGQPKVLLEAVACGTPVVVTDVGGCRAMAEGKGIVVPPEDWHALADAMETALSDEEAWTRWREACLDSTPELDWGRSTQILGALYDSLLAKGGTEAR